MLYIAGSTDVNGLKNVIANARRRGENHIADAAFRKLVCLGIEELPGTVEHDFWTTINALEAVLTEERDRTTRLSRTRQKLSRDGVVDTLSSLALKPAAEGFSMLMVRNMAEFTAESVILRHPELFSREVVLAASTRLENAG